MVVVGLVWAGRVRGRLGVVKSESEVAMVCGSVQCILG